MAHARSQRAYFIPNGHTSGQKGPNSGTGGGEHMLDLKGTFYAWYGPTKSWGNNSRTQKIHPGSGRAQPRNERPQPRHGRAHHRSDRTHPSQRPYLRAERTYPRPEGWDKPVLRRPEQTTWEGHHRPERAQFMRSEPGKWGPKGLRAPNPNLGEPTVGLKEASEVLRGASASSENCFSMSLCLIKESEGLSPPLHRTSKGGAMVPVVPSLATTLGE